MEKENTPSPTQEAPIPSPAQEEPGLYTPADESTCKTPEPEAPDFLSYIRPSFWDR